MCGRSLVWDAVRLLVHSGLVVMIIVGGFCTAPNFIKAFNMPALVLPELVLHLRPEQADVQTEPVLIENRTCRS